MAPIALDPGRPLRLDPQVALRPEPFGALAYHYRNRRLVFLRSHVLVDVVRSLDDHPSARSAIDAAVHPDSPDAPHRREALERALAALVDAEVLGDRD